MSYNCLITVNIGDFLTQYARDSFLNASVRWGCDFSEIHSVLMPSCPSASKLLGPILFNGYDKIMMLDADAVISDHAPSPFEICNDENVLYAVSDYQYQNKCDAWINGPYSDGMAPALSKLEGSKQPTYEQFFNSGMWMCIPNEYMIDMFFLASELLPDGASLFVEQGTLNVAAYNHPHTSVSIIPETWNHIIPQDCEPIPEYYINHFGGWAHELLKRKSQPGV